MRGKDIDILVGKRIRYYRLLRKIGRGPLAAAAGISKGQVGKYETGTNRVPASNLWTFAKVLHIQVEDLFDERDQSDIRLSSLRAARRLMDIQDKAIREPVIRLIGTFSSQAE